MARTDTPEAKGWLLEYGQRVRALREDAGLSQAALAFAAELHPTYVSGVECGHRNVSLVNIRALARALSRPVADFF